MGLGQASQGGDIGAKNGECEGADPLQYWRRVSQAKFLWKGNFEQYKGELDCLESNERSRDEIRVQVKIMEDFGGHEKEFGFYPGC